jgi:hypothetical protein
MAMTFDASKYLSDLNGRDYLEVKWRLLWLRTEHPDATIETELVKFTGSLALFRARVAVPGGGTATGWGSETAEDFGDFIEKAETKALGRALAALGYGTQFCEDFAFSAETERRPRQQAAERRGGRRSQTRVVDSPVARPGRPERAPAQPRSQRHGLQVIRDGPATPSQLKAIYSIARDQPADRGSLDERCRAAFGCLPPELTKRQASELIDLLRRAPAVAAATTG